MTARCIEVRAPDGSLMLSLHVMEKETAPGAGGQPNAPSASGQNDGTLMTDAQKRYLFRLVAEQGFENDRAHEHLKSLFGVSNLQEVSKADASQMIEQLLEQAAKK